MGCPLRLRRLRVRVGTMGLLPPRFLSSPLRLALLLILSVATLLFISHLYISTHPPNHNHNRAHPRRFMTELNLQWDSDYSDDFPHALGGQLGKGEGGQVGARQRGQLDFHTKREMDMREKKELETAAERTKQRLHLAALEHSPNSLVNGTSVEFGDKLKEMRRSNPLLAGGIRDLKRGASRKREPLPPKSAEPESVRQLENPEMTKFFGKFIDQAMKIKEGREEEYLEDCGIKRGHGPSAFHSALDRAKTHQCKAEIAVVGCSLTKAQLYPAPLLKPLPNYCHFDERERTEPLKLPGQHVNGLMDNRPPMETGGGAGAGGVFIVFLLQLSGRGERQVERLIKSIYSGRHAYLLHVDTDSEYLHSYLSQLVARFGSPGNIRLMKSRFQTLWGSSHLLLMQLAGYREATTFWPQTDFVINLSESDVRIRPVDELEGMLSMNRGMSFITGMKAVARSQFMKRQGVNQTFYQCDGHMFRLSARRVPYGVRFSGGSDWFVLARNFIDYLLHAPPEDQLVDPLSRFYSFSLLPSESFFSTIVKASPMCNRVRPTDLKFANWANKTGCTCSEKSTVDWCGCSPLVIRNISTFPIYQSDIKSSNMSRRPRFFARKFDSTISLSAINEVDTSLNERIGTPLSPSVGEGGSWNSYWLNFFHHSFDRVEVKKSVTTPLKYISAAIIMQHLPPHIIAPHHSLPEVEAKQMRADHFYSHDKYVGDVITLSLSTSSYKQQGEGEGKGNVVMVQTLVTRKEREKENYFDPQIFTSYAQVTTHFDSKENVSRSSNNWVTQWDSLVTLFVGFRRDFVRKIPPIAEHQYPFSVFLSQVGGDDPPTFEGEHKTQHLSVMFKQQFQIKFTSNCTRHEWLFEVFDPSDRLVLKQHFMVFGDRAKRSSLETYFSLEDSCIISAPTPTTDTTHVQSDESCANKHWSLFYPDPKSAFVPDRHVML
ncbi:xylosyltransferase 2-like isoform X2 [Symsagittifera roscoffensis]|uniref:xylosyltransferase 2-like isoform X2 n=1 Tax=Symsagittifera roscoffensis TaxID=84072 RepID=UPI00307BF532